MAEDCHAMSEQIEHHARRVDERSKADDFGTFAIHLEDMLRFPAQVECIGGFHLHAIGEFKRADSSLYGGFARSLFEVLSVDRLKQVELCFLLGPVSVSNCECSR